jgi:hypothetical protein
MIGAYASAPNPVNPLASIVEEEIKSGRFKSQVEVFLGLQPEKPEIDLVHIVSLSETHANCSCVTRVKDTENPKYFDAEVSFQVDLETGDCRLVTL